MPGRRKCIELIRINASFVTGELKIMEMRRKAERELAACFDVRAFHDEVLKDCTMPLQNFEAKMNTWLTQELQIK